MKIGKVYCDGTSREQDLRIPSSSMHSGVHSERKKDMLRSFNRQQEAKRSSIRISRQHEQQVKMPIK